jgi:Fur family ferric uptake transcriptional regulator
MGALAGKTGYRTRAQEELLAYLKATPGVHHTAAGLKEHFEKEGTPIATATIYRQLERFVDEGQIKKFILGIGESACYAFDDSSAACSSHFHCKCEQCGCLIHLDCEELKEIRTHLLKHHGFAWNAGKKVFYGLCDQCRKG